MPDTRAAVEHVAETKSIKKPACYRFLSKAPHKVLYLLRQVLIPSIEYSGQIFTTPVSNGSTPIHAHAPKTPDAAPPISAIPTAIRKPRSMLPTFAFMAAAPLSMY